MGILGWIRARFTRDREMEELLAMMDREEPRCHHYVFAHRAMPAFAFEDPDGCLEALSSGDADIYLARVWREVDENCRERGEPARFGHADVKRHLRRAGPWRCVILEMPEPLRTTEAHFVALAWFRPEDGEPAPAEAPPLRYLTLEKGYSWDGIPRTVFGEWTGEGTHFNMGDGPPPELDAFLERITQSLVPSPEGQ